MMSSPSWNERKEVFHCTTTHAVGSKEGDYSSFLKNIGLGEDWNVVYAHQVHGDEFIWTDRDFGSGCCGSADAVITSSKKVLCVVQTADCTPLLSQKGDIVAAVHAGWRGIANGIINRVLAELGGFDFALVGPLIAADCYEVGLEVIEAIEQVGVPRSVFALQHSTPGKAYADIRAAADWQLRQGGSGIVDHIERCTFKDKNLYSFRRQAHKAGRNFTCIGLH